MKSDWKVFKLGEVVSPEKGGIKIGPFGSQLKKAELSTSGIHVVGIENVLTGRFDDLGNRYISSSKFQQLKTCEVRSGDLLLTMMGTVGKVCVVPDGINQSIMDSHLLRIRPNKSVCDAKYLAWAIRGSPAVLGAVESNAHGAIMKGLNSEIVRSLPIALPPLPEQQRIVVVLDQAFESIAAAVSNAEKNLANVRELFQSEIRTFFANEGPGWKTKTLNQIADNLDSKRVPVTKNVRSSGPYPYFGATGIVDYVGDYIFDDDLLLVSEDGANLLARTYPIAFSITGKTWVNNHAHVLRFKEMATQKLVEFYLNSLPLDDYVSGMAQPKLNQKMLNTIPIPCPPLGEQPSIVAKFDYMSAETKRLEAIYQQKLAALEELKKSILHQAFTGQLH